MEKFFLSIITFFVTTLSFSHGTDTTFVYSILDEKKVESKQYYVDSLGLDCKISYLDSGHIGAIEYFKAGEPEGVHSYFSAYTHVLIKKSTFNLGKKTGLEVLFSQDGVVTDSVYYQDGVKSGMHKCFYPNGNVKSTIPYIKGSQEGVVYSYYPDGTKNMEIAYKKGVIHGGHKTFNKKGELVSYYTYKKGKYIAQLYPR